MQTRSADVIMNNPNAERECGNHIFLYDVMITEILTASICPLTDW